MIRMLRLPCAALCAATLVATPAYASNKDWGTVSDVGVLSLTAFSIGLPLVRGDTNGAFQAAGSIGSASLVATGLKEAFPETRPDGSDRKSFPSGHTAVSFAAAASIFEREGPSYGVPAFAVASLVGVARVEARKHHWYDALAGAGIGTAAGFLITRHRPERTAMIVPWGDTKGGGVTVAMAF